MKTKLKTVPVFFSLKVLILSNTSSSPAYKANKWIKISAGKPAVIHKKHTRLS